MKNKKAVAVFMVIAIIAGVLYGSQNSWFDGFFGIGNSGKVSAAELSKTLKEKYGDAEAVVYNKPLDDLPANQVIVFDVEFDPYDTKYEFLEFYEFINVFLDPELTVSANPKIEYDPEKKEITVAPPDEPVFRLAEYEDTSFSLKSIYADEEDLNQNWGYADKYYAVKFYNAKGEKLDKPIVTIFTVKHELDAPNIEFYKQDGFAALRWDAVEGATEYRIYKIEKTFSDYSGYYYSKFEYGQTADTDFVDESVGYIGVYDMINDGLSSAFSDSYYLAVIAVNENGNSAISNPIYDKDIAPILPFMNSYDGDDPESANVAEHVDELGVYSSVEMCDGSKVKMPITYHIDETEVIDMQDINSYIDYELFVLYIPYTVNGTSLKGFAIVKEYDYPELENDLQKLKDREIKKSKGGTIKKKVDLTDKSDEQEDEINKSNEKETKVTSDGYTVFATNALSEYLAINMLNGNKKINLDGFNEGYDKDYLVNAWYEAVYQNPLILGVQGFRLDMNNNLIVNYEQTTEEQQRKQKEINKEVKRIVSKIIKKGMTDLEKELAINDYLCETAEYDMAALENAEENDFKGVDPEFYDSFTPYGVLINKVGVCASYASAFKLLADEAGLDCIVVTGYFFGDLPHAWNRVLIDGEWMTVDSTNNDNAEMFNVLFNLPDDVAGTVLVEDDHYILAGNSGVYTGKSDSVEYYRVKELYYSQKQIVNMLVDGLNSGGSVTLRTDYELTDKQFYSIVQNVIKDGGFNYDDIEGGHWLGTIYLTLQ